MRLPDWQGRFSDFGKARASMPFEWGPNDCCSFAAASVEALTGVNPMADAEAYSTALAAARIVDEAGGMEALASAYLGPAVSSRMAGVGDVVLVINASREMLGVCNGVNVMAPGELGMVALGMESALAAWKI